MRLKVNNSQIQLLISNFVFVEGQGLQCSDTNLINETRYKEFLVTIWIGGYISQLRIFSHSSASARMVASKLFKNATVTADVKQI